MIAAGVDDASIPVKGNIVIDALLESVARFETDTGLRDTLSPQFLSVQAGNRPVLVTNHPARTWGGWCRTC